MMPRPKKKKLGKSLGLDQLTNPMMNPWMVNPMLWRQMGGSQVHGGGDPDDDEEEEDVSSTQGSAEKTEKSGRTKKSKRDKKEQKRKKASKDRKKSKAKSSKAKKKKKGSSSSCSMTSSNDDDEDDEAQKIPQWWTYLGPDFSKWYPEPPPASIKNENLRKNCVPRIKQLVELQPDRLDPGLLAGLTEYQLEMVHYVVTGLSPRTPVSELCVDTKGQLKRALAQCRDTKQRASSDQRFSMLKDDMSNVLDIANGLGWASLWGKPAGNDAGLAAPDYTASKWNNGEIHVFTKDKLRSLALGPAGAPCSFAFRNRKNMMVLSGSQDGVLPEFAIGCDEIFNGVGGIKKWWTYVAKLAVHELATGADWAQKYMATCSRLEDDNFQKVSLVQEHTLVHGAANTQAALQDAFATGVLPDQAKFVPGAAARQTSLPFVPSPKTPAANAVDLETKEVEEELQKLRDQAEKRKLEAKKEQLAVLKKQRLDMKNDLAKVQALKEAEDNKDEELAQKEAEVAQLREKAERLKKQAQEADRKKAEAKKEEEDKQKKLQVMKDEAERLKKETEEAERLEKEREEAERKKAAEEEAEKQKKLQAMKDEAERLKKETEEAERLEKEREEAEKQERAAQEEGDKQKKLQAMKDEAERLKKETKEAERLEKEREEAEKQEKAAQEEAEKQKKLQAMKDEAERLKKETEEAERLEKEREEAERLKKETEEEEEKKKAAEEEAEKQKQLQAAKEKALQGLKKQTMKESPEEKEAARNEISALFESGAMAAAHTQQTKAVDRIAVPAPPKKS